MLFLFLWSINDRNSIVNFIARRRQLLACRIFLKYQIYFSFSTGFFTCYLRNKICFPCLHSLVKTEENVKENSRADQWNPRPSRGFSPARKFSQILPRFSTDYEGTDNMFYFFYKIIIFSLNKEKDDIQSSYCKFSQLWDRSNLIVHVIFVLHSAM